jgi:ubiquinone/menaquinone biosynthesis C-methylase UbiE
MTPGRYLSFETVAGDYDQTRVIPEPQLEEIARILARESRLERGGLFLDGGVGTGRFAAPLARLHPAQIIGADIAPAMMRRIEAKTPPGSLALVRADLQRLPFRRGTFAGVLLVHILHLIEQWKIVLQETRRVLAPRGGILFLGVEQGGRSTLVDFYYERARARQVLAASLGSGMAPALAHLRRVERAGGLGARVTLLETPRLAWKRLVPIARTLEALAGRTYSQMWDITDETHRELMDETRRHAELTFPKRVAAETLSSRFALYKAWWP